MRYLQIGLRNVLRNSRRSKITILAVIIGMIACLLIRGFFNWNISEIKESLIRNGTGHYQLYATGFTEKGIDEPFQYLIADPEPIQKDLLNIPEVELVTARVSFNGILSTGERSSVTAGIAGNPEYENKLNAYYGLNNGAAPSASNPDGLIIGDGLARKLSAKIGDDVTLIANRKGGGINAVDIRLVGTTHTGITELDNISAGSSLAVIQPLLNIDKRVQKIVVLLRDTEDIRKVFPEIRAISDRYGLEFQTWDSAAELYQSLKPMYDTVFYMIILIVLVIVTFTISNTVNMNLNERFREIGTMRALGTRRSQVAAIFVIESGLIGLIGGLIGLGLAMAWAGIIEAIGGLPVPVQTAGQTNFIRVFFHPDILSAIICLGLFTLVAMVASIVPATRAARLSVTEALRWV